MGLATAGVSLFLWWLLAAASGAEAYARFLVLAGSPIGIAVLVGITFIAFQHVCSGLRHLYMDTGQGYEPTFSRRLAALTLVGSTTLTIVTWTIILFG